MLGNGLTGRVTDSVSSQPIDDRSGAAVPKKRFRPASGGSRRPHERQLGFEMLEGRELLSASPLLVNLDTAPHNANISNQIAVGNTVYYTVQNGTTGQADLWKSDGTGAGTTFIKSFPTFGGAEHGSELNLNGTLYFIASNLAGRLYEVWKSDGTTAGTVPVSPGGPYLALDLFNFNGTLYFVATNPIDNSLDLYKSDGTTAGTKVVKLLIANQQGSDPIETMVVGNKFYFAFNDGSGQTGLWVSDGTAAGTKVIKTVANNGPLNPFALRSVNGKCMFVATNPVDGQVQLWTSDGTAAGTKIVKTFANGGPFNSFTALVSNGTFLTFGATDPADGVNKLWKSDGTAAGTAPLKAVNGGFVTNPSNSAVSFGSGVLFEADGFSGPSLWKSDGTQAGTTLVDPGAFHLDPSQLTVVGSNAYFVAYDVYGTSGYELWKTDGTTAGTTLVKDIVPGLGSSNPNSFIAAGSRLAFFATTPTLGTEPWTSDGTAAGTKLVKQFDITDDGVGFLTYATLGGYAYYGIVDSQHGNAIVKSDGTTAGTTILTTLPGPPEVFYTFNNAIYFSAADALWKTDGTAAGTAPVTTTAGPIDPGRFFSIGNVLYFTARNGTGPNLGFELWRTDGTAAGTKMVKDINTGAGDSNPDNFANVNGTLYFTALNPADGQYELYKSNGTTAGTVLVQVGGPTQVRNLTVVNSTLYFAGFNPADSTWSIYTTNGTTETIVVPGVDGSFDGNQGQLASLPGSSTLYFVRRSAIDGQFELWRWNGSAQTSVFPQGTSRPTNISNLSVVNGKFWFQATNPLDGQNELYVSDGTAAGTTVLKTLGAGGPTNVGQFTNVNGYVYFTGSTAAAGNELWRTDGTSAGTVLVKDINPGSSDSAPTNFTTVNNALLFSANDGIHGSNELFILPNPPTVLGGIAGNTLSLVANSSAGPGAAVTLLAPAATVLDTSGNYANSKLTVSITGGDAGDLLAVQNQGTAAGQVGLAVVAGVTNLTYGGVAIGTVSGGAGATPLLISFLNNGSVTQAAEQAVVRAITYVNNSNPPTFTTRSVAWTVTNGFGAVSAPVTLSITLNSPPIVTAPVSVPVYQAGGSAVLIAPAATFVDANGNFAGSTLTVTPPPSADATDQLSIRAQTVGGVALSLNGTSILFGGAAVGSFSGGSGTAPLVVSFNASATQPAIQAVLQSVLYASTAAVPTAGTRSIQYQLSDGAGLAGPAVIASSVFVNNPTIIGGLFAPATFSVNSSQPVRIAPFATVTDPNGDYGLGVLTVAISANVDANDQLTIPSQGTAAGQIGVSGSTLTFGGAALGSFTGGTAGAPLVVTFSASATQAAVQAVVSNLLFSNSSLAASLAPRTVQFQITDGRQLAGPAATATVLINPAPVIAGVPGSSTYSANGPTLLLAPTATIADAGGNWASSILSVTITNATTFDRLVVRNIGTAAGQAGVSVTSFTGATSAGNISFGNQPIATFTTGPTAAPNSLALRVTFLNNANVTAAAVQAVFNNVGFAVATSVPSTVARTLQLQMTDGRGAVSQMVQTNLPINLAPVFANLGTSVAYNPGASPVLIAPTATVTDPGANYSAATLTVKIANADSADVLGIKSVGTAAGQVGSFGNAVFYGGALVATFSGGTGVNALSVVFAAGVTQPAIQAVVDSITFASTAVAPPVTTRTVQFQLRDALGAINVVDATSTKSVVVNQPPTLNGIGSSINYSASAALPLLLVPSTATITNPDGDFGSSVLKVGISNNAAAGDTIAVRNQGSAAGQVGFQTVGGVTSVTFGGVIIGTVTVGTGVNALSIAFASTATQAGITAVLQNIVFQTTTPGTVGTLPRTISFQLTDGGGLSSTVVLQTLTIVA